MFNFSLLYYSNVGGVGSEGGEMFHRYARKRLPEVRPEVLRMNPTCTPRYPSMPMPNPVVL